MASNNYTTFTYGGTQYNPASGAPAGYNAAGHVAYPAVTNAAYEGAAYPTAAVAAGQSGYAAAGAAGYTGYSDYGRALQSYDATKTFYQQAPAGYNTSPAVTVTKTHYSAPPVKNPNSVAKTPTVTVTVGKDPKGVISAPKAATVAVAAPTPTPVAAPTAYSNYDAALYSASVYMARQQQTAAVAAVAKAAGVWHGQYAVKNAAQAAPISGRRVKQPPRPQQLHYCDVCKISCAGPQTYREHLEGQKHKKRESSLKLQASAQTAATNRGNNYHCELCDVTCTGTDAYAAHVRGAKHQKVVKLHQKLGKPIPSDEPKKLSKINFVPASNSTTGSATSGKTSETGNETENVAPNDNSEAEETPSCEMNDNIKPVGGEYIEEIKDDEGKILTFNCKLCDCKFNDPNAKEMHMKGRRHRLQYKRKVQPDLVVEFKPRQSRLAGARAQRALLQAHRNANAAFGDEHDGTGVYWDEQRRRGQYEEEYDYNNWMARGFGNNHGGGGGGSGFGNRMGGNPPPFFGMMPGGGNIRRPESNDDRHAIARHADIYPHDLELQVIQRIVSHTERALKFVSDAIAEADTGNAAALKKEKMESNNGTNMENQILTFYKEIDTNTIRVLKGVMRVGFLAKGLLLRGDVNVELVVLCAEKPTVGLLKRVADLLPAKLKQVAGENCSVKYEVQLLISESAVVVTDSFVSVKISLTSPLLREAATGTANASAPASATANEKTISENSTGNGNNNNNDMEAEPEVDDKDLLPKDRCLRALAELRHAKWFQARATTLQSCVMVIRILRDLCQRAPAWQTLSQWALELLVEKVISSAGFPISPGDCLRRIMEAIASGFLLNGPGLLDPCEKEPTDALRDLSKQDREDLTVSAQRYLRLIAFRQIYKVLGMEQLPAMKFPMRSWRLNRKRRRSSGKGGGNGSIIDGENNADGDESSACDEKIPRKETGSVTTTTITTNSNSENNGNTT